MDRNKQLDFFKIILIILIVIHHSPYCKVRGYVAVEYFFIVSGYFMIQTFEHYKTMDTWSYLKKRLKRLYPHYIFSFFVMYLAVNRLEAFKFSNIVRGIPEIFLLQSVGFFKGGFNQPLWYLSVLVTASAVLFFLLKKLPIKIYNFMAILCIVIVYSYLLYCGKIEVWGKCSIFYIPWWRGTTDIFIGTLIYQLMDRLNQYIYKYVIEIHIIEIICTVLLIMCICIKDNEILDFVAVLCIIVLVMIM